MAILRNGSIYNLNMLAQLKVEDIKYVDYDDENHRVKLICHPNYDLEKILEFIENLPFGVDYEIIVEE